MNRGLIACAILCALAAVFTPTATVSAASIQKIKGAFAYQGRKVRVEIVRPTGDAPVPAALVLHGASGIGQGLYVYPFAEQIARRGVAAAVVRYYDGLGRKRGKASVKIFRTRDRILKAAIDYLVTRKDIRPDRIGVYGMSLGGFHALSLGVNDPRVKSVVSLGGGLSSHIPKERLLRLPPTLILHGGRDRVVPLKRALDLKQAALEWNAPAEIKIYKGEGHSLSRKARADAVESVAKFLSSTLNADRQVAATPAR